MSSNGGGDGDLDSLPPSAKYVLSIVERDAPLTRQELLDQTNLCERTLTRALTTLQNGGYVSLEQNPDDLREVVAIMADERAYNTPQSDRSG